MQFTFHNPTKIIFGAGSLEQLGEIVSSRGKRALLVTGGSTMDASQVIAAAPATAMSHIAVQDVLWIPSVLRAKNGVDAAGSSGDVCCRFSQRYVAPGKPNPGAEAFWKKMLAEQLTQLRAKDTDF